jgi:hypothetical protein
MVRSLIDYGRPQNNHRISINPNHIYIYRNDNHTIQQRNVAMNIQLAAQAGLDCVPLSIQWLHTVAEAWQSDPQEWLECDLSRPGHNTQHGAIPMPLSSTAAATAAVTAADMQAAGWERLRM